MSETEPASSTADQTDHDLCTSIMVGHSVSTLTDEAAVCISVCAAKARLSPVGARIVAAQLLQWADHAEALNKTQPGKRVANLLYRVMAKCDEKTREWTAVPAEERAAPPKEEPEPVPPTVERAKVHVKLRRTKPAAKRVATKRKAKR